MAISRFVEPLKREPNLSQSVAKRLYAKLSPWRALAHWGVDAQPQRKMVAAIMLNAIRIGVIYTELPGLFKFQMKRRAGEHPHCSLQEDDALTVPGYWPMLLVDVVDAVVVGSVAVGVATKVGTEKVCSAGAGVAAATVFVPDVKGGTIKALVVSGV